GSARSWHCRANAGELAQGRQGGQARDRQQQTRDTGTDGAVATQDGKCPPENGTGNRKKSGGILREGIAVRYAWIDSQRDSHPLQALCEMLGVSTSGYFDWKKCSGPTHWLSD